MPRHVITGAVVAFVTLAVPACAPVRLIPAPPSPSGVRSPSVGPQPGRSAAIHGRVVDANTGRPLRRAVVRSTVSGRYDDHAVATDEQGRYEVADLPPGRYIVSASKDSYLGASYGQTRPETSAQPVDLGEGQTIDAIDLKLLRGGVITGRVVDEFGDPVPEVEIGTRRSYFVQGHRGWVHLGPWVRTNDRGEYRISGLEPAEYLVAAYYRRSNASERDENAPSYGLTYAPRTLRESDARRVTISIGGSRDKIDITLVRVASARIAGTAFDRLGRPMTSGLVSLRNPTDFFSTEDDPVDLTPDGRFVMPHIADGEYFAEAEDQQPGRAYGSARATIVVAGHDLNDVRLTAAPRSMVSGKILIDAVTAATIKPSSVFLVLDSIDPRVIDRSTPRGLVNADLTFVAQVEAGTRRIGVDGLPRGVRLKAVRLGGVDVTDIGFDVKPPEIKDIEVELTNRSAVVVGNVTDRHDAAATECPVMVFARDERKWGDPMRHIRQATTDETGRFEVSGLPPGEYYVAAAYGIESFGGANNLDLLKRIRAHATRVSLRDGTTRTVNVQIAGS